MKKSDIEIEFTPGKTNDIHPKTTRSSSKETPDTCLRSKKDESDKEQNLFPLLKVRYGYKDIDPDVMECIVIMESVSKVDAGQRPSLLAYIANKLFGQKWIVEEDKSVDDHMKIEEEAPVVKKRKNIGCLEYSLPSRTSVGKMIEDFSILSYTDMAESVTKAKENDSIVTYGTDDTIKAAGNSKNWISKLFM